MNFLLTRIDLKGMFGLVLWISVSVAIGAAISYFSEIRLLTSTLIVMLALLINGLAMYKEDLEPGGWDDQLGITDTPQARKYQKKHLRIQGFIIIILFIALMWSIV